MKWLFGHFLLFTQAVLLVLFGIFTRYSDELGSGSLAAQRCAAFALGDCETEGCVVDVASQTCTASSVELDHFYPFYQDVHVMVYVGFGFLMTFLYRYGFSAVGYNMLLSAVALQWSLFTTAFWHRVFEKKAASDHINLDVTDLITSDFAAAAVLISFGAVLGKASPSQLLIMVIFELIFFSLSESIGVLEFEAVDMGGSIFVHMFGAYFGLGVSKFLGNVSPKRVPYRDHIFNTSTRTSDLFAMIGTLFLFLFWPSFNGALATGAAQHRVVINTVISLAFSAVSAFAFSQLLRPERKFNMVDIQNATLAGGVAVGSSADLIIEPWGAALIGFIAGLVSVAGYVYLSDILDRRLGMHDTAGVHNLHGMPGLMGGIGGAISAALAGTEEYGQSIADVYPARGGSDPRSAGEQAGYQLAAIAVTLVIAFAGGCVTGLLMRWLAPYPEDAFEDDQYWSVEEGLEQKDVDRELAAVETHVVRKLHV
eukprot:m.84290 g.84290  ORF g.84290 m.84290 type:complete len:482 (-) comp14682_c0_seq4:146-1591(-)